MPEKALNPELAAVEAALAALTPSAQPLDRDQLFYRAGQATAPRRSRLWPAATAVFALCTVGLGMALAIRLQLETTHIEYVFVEPPGTRNPPAVPGYGPEGPDEPGFRESVDPRPSSLSSLRLEQAALRSNLEIVTHTTAATTQEVAEPPTRPLRAREAHRLELETP